MLLHKDLGREQLARKRLHNEMEDMKGKIRVYVRIRPFSKKEKDMGCQEAVFKVPIILLRSQLNAKISLYFQKRF